MFKFYCREFEVSQVEDTVAKRLHHITGVCVSLCQIEDTSGIFGMGRASDGEAAALADRYFVRAEDHHCMRRCQRDAGLVQFH